MVDITFPYSAPLLGIRRQTAPTAKWISVTKTWQMTEAEADSFMAAASQALQAAGQTLVAQRDLHPVTLGAAECVDEVYDSEEPEIDEVDAVIAAAARDAEQHNDGAQAYFARIAAGLWPKQLPSPQAIGAILLCLQILADEDVIGHRCKYLAARRTLTDVEAIVARGIVDRNRAQIDNEDLVAAALDVPPPESAAEPVAVPVEPVTTKPRRGRPTNLSRGKLVMTQSERNKRYRATIGIVSLDVSGACARRLRAMRDDMHVTTEQLIENALDALMASKHRQAA